MSATNLAALHKRYALRAEGEYTRDTCEMSGASKKQVLEATSSRFKGADKLHFRQGFLYRDWEIREGV